MDTLTGTGRPRSAEARDRMGRRDRRPRQDVSFPGPAASRRSPCMRRSTGHGSCRCSTRRCWRT